MYPVDISIYFKPLDFCGFRSSEERPLKRWKDRRFFGSIGNELETFIAFGLPGFLEVTIVTILVLLSIDTLSELRLVIKI